MKCNLCGKEIKGYGNNPYPLIGTGDDEESRCCDSCNSYVIIARMAGGKWTPKDVDEFKKELK